MEIRLKYEEIPLRKIMRLPFHRGHGKSTMMKEYLKYIIKRYFGI